jgi:hypothetical protein
MTAKLNTDLDKRQIHTLGQLYSTIGKDDDEYERNRKQKAARKELDQDKRYDSLNQRYLTTKNGWRETTRKYMGRDKKINEDVDANQDTITETSHEVVNHVRRLAMKNKRNDR